MKRLTVAVLFAASLLTTACAVVPTGHGGAVVVPILPPLVVLDTEPYYFYQGYHYHYRDRHWFYSRSRRGPWGELPRDHYPRELRFKDRDRGRGRGDRDRDRSRRDRY